MPSIAWLEVGKVVAPQGLNGDVRVYPDSDFPERFEQPGPRWLRFPEQQEPQAIELLRGRYLSGKGLYVLKFAGIESREQAEALRGCGLLVRASDRPVLEAGEFYLPDLIGLAVFDQQTQSVVGTVVDTFRAGHDLLSVKLLPSQRAKAEAEIVKEPKTPEKAGKMRRRRQRKTRSNTSKQDTILIPFVEAIVPVVDLEQQRIEIDPPPGLLDVEF